MHLSIKTIYIEAGQCWRFVKNNCLDDENTCLLWLDSGQMSHWVKCKWRIWLAQIDENVRQIVVILIISFTPSQLPNVKHFLFRRWTGKCLQRSRTESIRSYGGHIDADQRSQHCFWNCNKSPGLSSNSSTQKTATTKETAVESEPKLKKQTPESAYNNYSDITRETFVDRILESPEKRGRITRFAKELGINGRTTLWWWSKYQATQEVPYKKSKENTPISAFISDHQEYARELLDNDPQLFAVDIIDKLTEQFMDFTISKSQLNHHLENTMFISVQSPLLSLRWGILKRTCEQDTSGLWNGKTQIWIMKQIVFSLMRPDFTSTWGTTGLDLILEHRPK